MSDLSETYKIIIDEYISKVKKNKLFKDECLDKLSELFKSTSKVTDKKIEEILNVEDELE